LTIGSLTGTNIEIVVDVGTENSFQFGLTAEEVTTIKSQGYNPRDFYNTNTDLKEVIDLISAGFFSKEDATLFKPFIDSLLSRDEQMVLTDYQSYIDCQDRVSTAFKDKKQWTKMSIIAVARMGRFSSDRSIREYCEKIWHATPLKKGKEHL